MNLPTKITFSRIILVVVLFLFLFIYQITMQYFPESFNGLAYGPSESPIYLEYLIAFIVFVVAASTDALDGYLARKNNQITDLGKFLDPIADKMLVNATLIFLCFPLHEFQLNISVYIVILFVVRDLIVDGMRLMAAKKNIVVAANVFGKLKTIFQMIAIPVYLLNGFPFSYFDSSWPKGLRIADFLIYLALFFSILSMIIYLYQNRKVFLNKKEND